MTAAASDRVYVITGAGSGLGLETAVRVASLGAHVGAVCRDEAGAEVARAEIARRSGSDRVAGFACDLASQGQVRGLARRLASHYPRIDGLAHVAAAIYSERTLSEDGVEMQLAVNHIAPFLLTRELMPTLEAADAARVVVVTSRAHARATLDLDDLGLERRYSVFAAYDRSKLANVLFTHEMARRVAGSRITVNCVQPGLVRTGIGYKHTGVASKLLWWAMSRLGSRPSHAARRIVELLMDDALAGVSGRYFSNGRPARPSAESRDEGLARRLWEVSETLTA